jgi:hypothetical protein
MNKKLEFAINILLVVMIIGGLIFAWYGNNLKWTPPYVSLVGYKERHPDANLYRNMGLFISGFGLLGFITFMVYVLKGKAFKKEK